MSETPPPMTPISAGAPMSCAEVRPYLSAYVDGELAEPLRAQVARHLRAAPNAPRAPRATTRPTLCWRVCLRPCLRQRSSMR